MADGINNLLQGATSAQRRMEALANNIANANTPGFLQESVQVKSSEDEFGVPESSAIIDLTPGPAVATGAALDIAPVGGFLVIETPNGERYTRAGQLSQDDSGTLVTTTGKPVLTTNGPVSSERPIRITNRGEVYGGDEFLGRLRLVDITDNSKVTREGAGLIRVPEEHVKEIADPAVTTGSIITSSVDPVATLIQVITVSRAYEAYQQAMHSDDTTERKAMTLGRV